MFTSIHSVYGENAPTRLVRISVINDNIVRVEATPESSFPKKQSLMIVPEVKSKKTVVVEIGKSAGTETLKTSNLQISVDRRNGNIGFFDKNGKAILSENENGNVSGKQFWQFRVPKRELGVVQRPLSEKELNGWSWQLQFKTADDEAFYGLGQHQSEELNMRGKNEDLFQYNTKVAVPFVISNHNYGILWDSYSYGRFGNPNEYLQLGDAFRLYDKEGKEGSLTGTYSMRGGRSIVRNEDSLYFENSETIGNLPKGINLGNSQVTYEGFIESPTNTTWRFILYYAGYVRVFIDGQEVVSERWRTAWNPNAWKFEYPMKSGQKVPLRIEWRPDGGVSYLGLRVATPRTEQEQGQLTIWNEMSPYMDYYFINGQSLDDVISGYRTLTGKAPILPRWALGFWQSRERYKTQDEIVSTLAEFRKRQIPIDNIVQDWNYWEDDKWGSHEFEASRFPDPQKMIDDIHSMNGHYMISVWPKFYASTEHYKEMDSNGWMYRQAVKDEIRDWVGPGYVGSFYDAYDTDAQKLFWKQMDDHLYSKYNKGIDAWWMDASEPNVRDCTPMWYRKALCGPTALGTSTEYFNAYSVVNAKAIYEGQMSVNPDKRVFQLTRSGFSGLQRYSAATWSGDIGTRWEDMRAQMTAGMNYNLSGLPFWGMDNGGFCVENRYSAAQQMFDRTGNENDDLKEWRELQTRWTQFGCFVPLYRTHGQWPLREVWNIAPEGHPAYESIVYYHRLRYHLMPYIYSIAAWVHLMDYTMMRALPMDFPDDKSVVDIKDQWMFGPALMACPVGYYKARSREVYFPKSSDWYDLYSGQYIKGGQTLTVDAPYERIPVFVRAGSILPIGPALQWSDEKPSDIIDLYIYQGKSGRFMFYEDEGTNNDYLKGKYSTIIFSYDDAHRLLTISPRKGEFPGMLKNRKFRIHSISKTSPEPLNLANPQGNIANYYGKEIKVNL